jgi:Subtilase family
MYKKFTMMLAVGAFFFSPLSFSVKAQVPTETEQTPRLSENAKRQIAALLADKQKRLAQRGAGGRTTVSDKLSLSLRSAIAQEKGGESLMPDVPLLSYSAERNEKGDVALDITAEVTKKLLGAIEQNGGQVFFASAEYRFVQAYLPLKAVEAVATLDEVRRIEFSHKAELNGTSAERPKTETFLSSLTSGKILNNSSFLTGAVNSQGDAAHRANLARSTFGVNGTGVKVGVLSDSVRYLANSQASGDLPANVTVLPGQSGIRADGSDIGEGTAMLEIIYDLAPGAQLYFATGIPNAGVQNPVAFAANIRALRNAGCNIIVDDVAATFGADGTPFQDTIAASAINDVTASGVFYVTAAGNEGNKNDGTSGTWEGDFTPSGSRFVFGGVDYGELHDFSPSDANATNNATSGSSGGSFLLWWADSYGGSTVDYDLFLVSPDGSQLLGASTDRQNGESIDFPFEGITPQSLPIGSQIIVLRYGNAPRRALHLDRVNGRFRYNTDGAIRGHNAAANSLSIAATPSGPFTPNGGPQGPLPGVFNQFNEVERFSRNGPRRLFYNANNTPITPNNFLFSTNGGRLIQKVDFTGADGVATTLPVSTNLNPFFGTSAAAPHIAAIVALVKSANPQLNRQQIIAVLTTSAIDIETPGPDRDSGWGIVDAYRAVASAGR